MEKETQVDESIVKAVKTIQNYITQTTGIEPQPEEIAQALTKYFVLKEIGEFIELSRQENL